MLDIILDAQFMIYLILIYHCQDQPETVLGIVISSLWWRGLLHLLHYLALVLVYLPQVLLVTLYHCVTLSPAGWKLIFLLTDNFMHPFPCEFDNAKIEIKGHIEYFNASETLYGIAGLITALPQNIQYFSSFSFDMEFIKRSDGSLLEVSIKIVFSNHVK